MTDITREAVKRLAKHLAERGEDPLTLLALRDALDKAERERDELAGLLDANHRQECDEIEKLRRERDDYAQAARVEASARREFMHERDDALTVLREIVACGVFTQRARAILAKHEVKT